MRWRYIELIERNDATMNMKVKHDMTKRNTTSNETPSIALKTVLRDIERDNKGVTMNDKRVRAWLRANMRDAMSHDHNA